MSILEESNIKKTPISELGEFGLIEHITKSFDNKKKSTIFEWEMMLVIEYNKDKYHLLSTDMLVEGVHFDLAYTPLKHLGYKSYICECVRYLL